MEAYRLDKASLEHILRARPELAEGISVILEQRRSRFAALEQGHANGSLGPRSATRVDASAIRKLCETHEMDLEEVNRALLRVLADLEVERPAA